MTSMRFMAFAVGGDEDWSTLDVGDVERAIHRYTVWTEKVARSGNLVSGGSLDDDVQVVTRSGDTASTTVTATRVGDRHSRIRGWTEVEAESLEEAAALFVNHPHLEFGSIEIRPVTDLNGPVSS